MLLLLRGDPPANPGVVFSTQSGIAFTNTGVGVTFSTVTGFSGLNSIELNVSVNFDAHAGFAATGRATTGPGVTFGTLTGMALVGGFGGSLTLANSLNSGWTVGTTLQGNVTFANPTTLTGDLRAVVATTFALVSDFKPGAPDLSGGTLTPGVSFGLLTSFAGTPIFVDSVTFDLHTNIIGTGFPSIVGLATDMRLTFECDQIRTFFRKG